MADFRFGGTFFDYFVIVRVGGDLVMSFGDGDGDGVPFLAMVCSTLSPFLSRGDVMSSPYLACAITLSVIQRLELP